MEAHTLGEHKNIITTLSTSSTRISPHYPIKPLTSINTHYQGPGEQSLHENLDPHAIVRSLPSLHNDGMKLDCCAGLQAFDDGSASQNWHKGLDLSAPEKRAQPGTLKPT